MFNTMVFIPVKKKYKYPNTREYINKAVYDINFLNEWIFINIKLTLMYVLVMKYCLSVKNNQWLAQAPTWMNHATQEARVRRPQLCCPIQFLFSDNLEHRSVVVRGWCEGRNRLKGAQTESCLKCCVCSACCRHKWW
jgi:hypothetical protein